MNRKEDEVEEVVEVSKEQLIQKARKQLKSKSKTQLINVIINLSFQLDKCKGGSILDKLKFWR